MIGTQPLGILMRMPKDPEKPMIMTRCARASRVPALPFTGSEASLT